MNNQIGSLSLAYHTATQDGGQWIHIVPNGTFTGRDGRGPYALSDPVSVMRESQAYAGGYKIPVDYDHQIDHAEKNGKPAPAAGWITALQVREDGIWGRVEWTARAASYIAGGEYRYLSPVFNHTREGTITRLLRVSLTNNPNLQLKALFSASNSMETTTMDELLAKLRQLLGLDPEADAEAIMAKIGDMKTGKEPDPSQFVPIAEFEKVMAELNSLKQGVSRQSAIDHVELQIRNANMPSYLREWGVAMCSVNKPAFDAFIQRTKGMFNKLTAHSSFGAPDATGKAALSDDERDVCRRMGLSPEEFAASKSFIESGKA